PPHLLATLDDLRDLGELEPDQHFLLKRIEGIRDDAQAEEALYRAVVDLLRSGIPLSQHTRDLTAGELERLWWPDLKAEKRRRNEMRAHLIDAQVDVLVAEGNSVETAWKILAEQYEEQSGAALERKVRRLRRKADK